MVGLIIILIIIWLLPSIMVSSSVNNRIEEIEKANQELMSRLNKLTEKLNSIQGINNEKEDLKETASQETNLQNDADINIKNNYGVTALMLAARDGDLEKVKYIADFSDINSKDNNGRTALMTASVEGYLAIVKYLVEKGAYISIKNNNGRTALMMALDNGHLEIVKYLTEKSNLQEEDLHKVEEIIEEKIEEEKEEFNEDSSDSNIVENAEQNIMPSKANLVKKLDVLMEKIDLEQSMEKPNDKNSDLKEVSSQKINLQNVEKEEDLYKVEEIDDKKSEELITNNEIEEQDLYKPEHETNVKAPFSLASFERFLAQKVMVILGGIFFVIASFIFIKYSIDNNLFTPAIRITGAIIFGLILFSLGMTFDSLKKLKELEKPEDSEKESLLHKIDRKIIQSLSMPPKLTGRIAQTCIGAGVVVEFFSVYGGYILYDFFGGKDNSFICFALLCVISFGALFLTLRFGIIVGVFGLLGGFATPILISSENPNFYLLCGYLIALHICVMYIAHNRSDILPLLSSAFVLGYMWLFVETTKAVNLGESIFAFIICCGVFFTLAILAMQIFDDERKKSKTYIICEILFWLVSIFGFWVVLNIAKPENIDNVSYGFAFIVVLCIMNLFAPFFVKIIGSSKLLERIFKVDESLKNPKVFDYSSIFSLTLAVVYLLGFSRSLPNYCIIILESIFIVGFIANLLANRRKLLYLSLLLIASVGFAVIESIETNWIFSNIASLIICVIVYSFIVAKDLENSKSIRVILSLNALMFFGAIFLLVKNTVGLENSFHYMYLFCIIWFLAFLLLFALNDRTFNFKGKSLRLRNIPDLAFIGALCFALAAGIFFYRCGRELIFNILGNPYYSMSHLEIYAIFSLACAVNLWLLNRFCIMQAPKYNDSYPSIISVSFKEFIDFCAGFQSVIFWFLSVFITAFIGAVCAKIYYILELEKMKFIGYSLYVIAGATLFGIFAIIVAKMYSRFIERQKFSKYTKIIFYIFSVKSLWFYLVALYGWQRIFFSQIDGITYWSVRILISYCLLSFIGFIVIFFLNEASLKHKIIKNKYPRYFLDFISLLFIICAVICIIHCAFGVEGDISDSVRLGEYAYKFVINGVNELYAYSAALVCISVALLIIGIVGKVERFKHYCFGLLVIIALKVFFVDTSSFSSIGKVVLFMFMGVTFIGISVIYSKFVLKRDSHD